MDFFENLFQSKSKVTKPSIVLSPIEQSMLDCKLVRDRVKQYIKKIELNSKESHQKAKDYLGQGKKDRAKFYLTQKKMYLEQIKNSEIQLETINKQISSIEMAVIQTEIMKVMKSSNAILIKLQEEVCVENWNIINDELSEYKEEQRQVAEFFSNRVVDDEDIVKELNELEELEFPDAEKGSIMIENEGPKENEKEKQREKQIIEA